MSTIWAGLLEVDDSGFEAKITGAITKVEETGAKVKETTKNVEESVSFSFMKMKMISSAAMNIIQDIFSAMGIELGAMGNVVESGIQVAIAIVGISGAETGASMGAAAFNLAMAGIALGTAIAAQQKNDQAKAALGAARSMVQMTRAVSTI